VEAQTCTVWTQADRQQLPRLVFVNKMDRADADFEASVQSLRSRLDAIPVAVQEPLKDRGTKGFTALLDLVHLRLLRWDGRPSPNVASEPLDGHLLELAAERRLQLVEQLADLDESLAEQVIRTESLAAITPKELTAALRRATVAQVPNLIFYI
jgi:elongation factor G